MGCYLKNIKFELTGDNSTGLFDNGIGDIYHSKSGALKEAYDKFINPVISSGIQFYEKISILDICYGIGYNSKAALNKFDNYMVNIDALEFYNDLIFISPFVKDNLCNNSINLFLLNKIINSFEADYKFKENFEYISKNIPVEFLNDLYADLTNFISKRGYKYISGYEINDFLHNIYYNYISNSMLNNPNSNKYTKSNIKFYTGDARQSINSTVSQYDVVFLDGFSPKKDPRLWTIDFLSQIKNKMKPDSVLVSYSKSIPFRSALLELGFCVGKTFIDNEDMGTVCSLNKLFIKTPLDDIDYKIISSRSGIPYRDSTLSHSASEIINNRNLESKYSDRISRTQLSKLINI